MNPAPEDSVPMSERPTDQSAPDGYSDFVNETLGVLERPGDCIGPYRLLRFLGDGGFGTVWLAEREHPHVQRVALKIVTAGMNTREVLDRFDQERQLLAVMDHPNIARIFDGGVTPGGRPYFAMEYVKGVSITKFCDDGKLSIPQRLALFITVCEAVQHAHYKGVIHRDIKPANILVGFVDTARSGGESSSPGDSSAYGSSSSPGNSPWIVKVIDFGVAKALHHAALQRRVFTEIGRMIGTPEYMSPEQAEMGPTDIDTRTDVYSLGAVLYELLAGAPPLDPKTLRSKAYDEMRRFIRVSDPPTPSDRFSGSVPAERTSIIAGARKTTPERLIRDLRQDLEQIPLMALRKNRAERYATPASLADDIHRYLQGQPVNARPPSVRYRVSKFVRRNRVLVGFVVGISAAVLTGLVGTSLAATWALDERASARAAAAREKEAANLANRIAYFANIGAADGALRLGEAARARKHLDECASELRGWEWQYLHAQLARSTRIGTVKSESLRTLSLAPGGITVVAAGDLDLFRMSSATLQPDGPAYFPSVFQRLGERARFLAASPDGRWFLTGHYPDPTHSEREQVWLTDAAARTNVMMVSEMERDPATRRAGFTFSDDGRFVAVQTGPPDGPERRTSVFDTASRRRIADLPGASCSAFFPGGEAIVIGLERPEVYSLGDGVLRVQSAAPTAGFPTRVAVSPDGTSFCTGDELGIKLWNARTGDCTGHIRVDQSVTALTYIDAARAVAACGPILYVLDVSNRIVVERLFGHSSIVWRLSWDAARQTLYSGDEKGEVRSWNLSEPSAIASVPGAVNGSIMPGGRLALFGWGSGAGSHIINLSTGATHAGPPVGECRPGIDPSGNRMATLNGDTASIWNLQVSPSEPRRIPLPALAPAKIDEAPNSPQAVFVDADRLACIRPYADGVRVDLIGLPSGNVIWTRTFLTSADYRDFPHYCALGTSATAGLLAVASVTNVELLRLKDGTTAKSFQVPDAVSRFLFSLDDAWLAWTRFDGEVGTLNLASGAVQEVAAGREYVPPDAAWIANPTRLVTVSHDAVLKVWQPDSAAPILSVLLPKKSPRIFPSHGGGALILQENGDIVRLGAAER